MGTYYRKTGTLFVLDTTLVAQRNCGFAQDVQPSSVGWYAKLIADPRDAVAIRKWRRAAMGYEQAILQVVRGGVSQDAKPCVSIPNGQPFAGEIILNPYDAPANYGGFQPIGGTWETMNPGEPAMNNRPWEYYWCLWVTKGLSGLAVSVIVEWWL